MLAETSKAVNDYRRTKEKADHVSMIGLYLCRQRGFALKTPGWALGRGRT
jgi:hypothetical protein